MMGLNVFTNFTICNMFSLLQVSCMENVGKDGSGCGSIKLDGSWLRVLYSSLLSVAFLKAAVSSVGCSEVWQEIVNDTKKPVLHEVSRTGRWVKTNRKLTPLSLGATDN